MPGRQAAHQKQRAQKIDVALCRFRIDAQIACKLGHIKQAPPW